MATERTDHPDATRFDGKGAWDFGTIDDHLANPVTEVIIREAEIVIDWEPVDGWPVNTILRKVTGSSYSGQSVWAARTARQQTADVEAVLYTNELGHMLVGEEHWSNGDDDWFVLRLSNARPVS
jgi:hypothetical protein